MVKNIISKSHLLILGGSSETIVRALRIGFEVSYLGSCENSENFDASLLEKCFFVHEAKVEQVGICLGLANGIQQKKPIDAVISFTELGMETAAVIANAIGVKGLELGPTCLTRYKDRMRKVLAEKPELKLPWKQLSSRDDLLHFYSQNGPALIIKPVSGSGSSGVQQIKSLTELDSFCDQFNFDLVNDYMVEKLIEGDTQYSVETISVEGKHYVISMSQAKLSGYPYTLAEYYIVPPYNLENSARENIISTVCEFLDTINLVNGVAHTEIKLDSNQYPYIIESQTRVGGDNIWQMVELTTGISLVDLVLESFLRPIQVENLPKSSSVAGFFCLLPPKGRVKLISDTGFLKKTGCIIDYCISIKPGTTIKPIKNNLERYGFIALQAPTHIDLFNQANLISKKLRLEYDDKIWYPAFK